MSDCRLTTFGLVDGRPVFMDLGDDSYFMLESGEEAAFLASAGEEGAAGRDPLQPEGSLAGPVECARPRSSALADPRGRRRGALLDALRVWRLLLGVRSALRHESIAAVVSGCAGREGPAAGLHAAADAPVLAARFARARRLVPLPANCLSDSLALLRWLLGHGAGGTLVFGVKLDPFAAHCWVQTEEMLLNDHPERVERFNPVRAIACTPPMP